MLFNGKYMKIMLVLMMFISFILIIGVLKISTSVVLPLIIAILVSLVFEPIIATLNRKFKIPWFLGIIIVMTITVIAIFAIGSLIVTSLTKIVEVYPKYEERFMIIYENIAELFHLPYNENNTLFENLWGQLGVRSTIQSLAFSLSSYIINFLKSFLMVCLFVIFFLLELRYFRKKLEVAFAGVTQGKIAKIIADIISQVSRYMSLKFYISLLTGIIVWVGCLLIGVDFSIIHGFLAFIANFIPNFGSIFSCILTSIFALLQFWPSPLPIILTIVLMVGTNMIIGNFIEPRIQGKNLGLSPFVIIASLSLWGWIWGFVGMIIAVPLMVIFKIICENVSILNPISVIMGNTVETSETNSELIKKEEE